MRGAQVRLTPERTPVREGLPANQWSLAHRKVELPRFGGHLRIWEKGVHKRNQYSYPPEYRARMVELVRAGRTPEELGREFEPTAQSIRSWVNQANLDEGRRADGLTSTEREELRRLRRENRQLQLER